MHALKSFILTCAFVSAGVVVFGADGALTMAEALAIAEKDNARIVQARAQVQASRGRLQQAGAVSNPELGGEWTRPEAADGPTDWAVSIDQPFSWPAKWIHRRRVARADADIAAAELNAATAEVRKQVRQAYLLCGLGRRQQEAEREDLARAGGFLDLVLAKHQVGSAALGALARARLDLAQAENELWLAQTQTTLAKSRLNRLLNRPGSEPLELQEALSFEPIDLDEAALTSRALKNNPQLKISRLRAAQGESAWRLARWERLPDPVLGVAALEEESVRKLSFRVQMPLPLWNFNSGEIAAAKAGLASARSAAEAEERELLGQLEEALLQVDAAGRRVALFKKSYEQTQELLGRMDLQYKEGRMDYLSYLDGRKAVQQARAGYYQAVFDHQCGLFEIESLVGEEFQ